MTLYEKLRIMLSGRFTLFKIVYLYIRFLLYTPDKQIGKLKNCCEGKRCFIVGLGPSLQVNDLETLYEKGEICFSVNRIYHIFEKTNWRPNFFLVSDKRGDDDEMVAAMKEMEGEGVVTICSRELKLSPLVHPVRYRSRNYLTPLINSKLDFFRKMAKPCRYSINPEKFIYDGSSCIHSVIQFAGYMGFSEVYLIGCDCDSFQGKDYNEFIRIKTDGMKYKEEGVVVIDDYQSIKDDMEYKEIAMSIFNSTRGGKLEVFPRRNFDDVINH